MEVSNLVFSDQDAYHSHCLSWKHTGIILTDSWTSVWEFIKWYCPKVDILQEFDRFFWLFLEIYQKCLKFFKFLTFPWSWAEKGGLERKYCFPSSGINQKNMLNIYQCMKIIKVSLLTLLHGSHRLLYICHKFYAKYCHYRTTCFNSLETRMWLWVEMTEMLKEHLLGMMDRQESEARCQFFIFYLNLCFKPRIYIEE